MAAYTQPAHPWQRESQKHIFWHVTGLKLKLCRADSGWALNIYDGGTIHVLKIDLVILIFCSDREYWLIPRLRVGRLAGTGHN